MGSITIPFPWWYLIGCLLLGALAAALLYYRESVFAEKPRTLRLGLAVLRGMTVALLAFLLLSPLLKRMETEIRKPAVVFLHDASESLARGVGRDSLERLRSGLADLAYGLSGDYDVEHLSFGEMVRTGIPDTFMDKETDLEQALRHVGEVFDPRQLGAVILVSDGIHNRGAHPLYSPALGKAPLYSVAIGDPTPSRDLAIKRLFHNRIAYKGDRFTVQLDISARYAEGESSELQVHDLTGGTPRLLLKEPVRPDGATHFETREVVLEAGESGLRRYRFSLVPLQGERNLANNSREMFIEVLDARQRILILADAPHPDISAIRQALATGKNYQAEVRMRGESGPALKDYDLLILHQLPSGRQPSDGFLQEWKQARVPSWFILTPQSDLRMLAQFQGLLQVRGDGRNANEVYPQWAGGFQLFTLSDALTRGLPRFPPLTAPFGEFAAGPGARVLMNQRIGSVTTDYPLWVLGEEDGIRKSVLAGEGLWRWRVFDFLQQKRHELSDELITKTVQYLALKEDKRRFRVTPARQVFQENESVVLDGELYNDNWELINDPEVQVTLKNAAGEEFPYAMSRSSSGYSLQAGMFPPGEYAFTARTALNRQDLAAGGRFTVQSMDLEGADLQADHNLLRAMSEESGGALVPLEDLGRIADMIRANPQIKPVMYASSHTRPLIDWRWLFGLLLLLLGLEWFIRRYSGAY